MTNTLPRSIQREDLESAGRAGLVAAAQTWSPSLGVHFSYYCRFRIRGAMLDELRAMDPAKRRSKGNGSNGNGHRTVAIDGVVLYAEESPDPLTLHEFPGGLLRLLDDRERQILIFRYTHDMHFSEIGEKMGLCATRVAQIHNCMLAKAMDFYRWNGIRARA